MNSMINSNSHIKSHSCYFCWRNDMEERDRMERLVKAAHMYYDEKLPKSKIAPILNISPTHVANLINEAHDLGIVRIVIEPPSSVSDPLIRQLRERFSCLEEAIVVSTGED